MTLVLDAGPLISLADRRDPLRPAIRRILREEPGQLVLPAPVSAEVDHLLGRRLGRPARQSFLTDLAAGKFLCACLEQDEYELVRQYDQRYADLDVGLADFSVVILAHRFNTRRILTLDLRHFRTLKAPDGESFVLLPFDEPELLTRS